MCARKPDRHYFQCRTCTRRSVVKRSPSKVSEDLDWYWRDRFADANSPDYFDRRHWWEPAPGRNKSLTQTAENQQQDIDKSLVALHLSLIEQLRYLSLLCSPD